MAGESTRKSKNLLTSGDIARSLGVAPHRVTWILRAYGGVRSLTPVRRERGRRLYGASAVGSVRGILAEIGRTRDGRPRRRGGGPSGAGLITSGEIARRLGVDVDRVTWVLRRYDVRPARRAGGYRIYDDGAVDQVREVLAEIARRRAFRRRGRGVSRAQTRASDMFG